MKKEIAKYVDDLTIVEIADTGHSPFLDQKEALIAAMEDFFNEK
jgi:pimeloyl-ACP methyl ester carboxylesterase